MCHMVVACGNRLGRQLNDENMFSKKLPAIV